MKRTSQWHITKKLQESFRSSEVVAILLPTSPWAPSPVNWRAGVVLMMNSLCSGKAGKGGVCVEVSVNSFADNIAAQIDPIRWAALYLSGSSGGDGGGRPSSCPHGILRGRISGGGGAGHSSPERSAKQILVLPRNTLPAPRGLLCLRVRESVRRGRQLGCRLLPAAAPGGSSPEASPSHRPPQLRGAEPFGADTDNRSPSPLLSSLPARS